MKNGVEQYTTDPCTFATMANGEMELTLEVEFVATFVWGNRAVFPTNLIENNRYEELQGVEVAYGSTISTGASKFGTLKMPQIEFKHTKV